MRLDRLGHASDHPNWKPTRESLECRILMLGRMQPYIGQAAGVATSMLWTATSLLFAAAARRIGPTLLNTLRIAFAVALHGLTFRLVSGDWIPDALPGQITYLAVSGIVGLTIGDQALFTALVDIGPRRCMLIMATSPLFATFFGWLALGETLEPLAWLAIALTIGGVAWVIMERPARKIKIDAVYRTRGIVLAFVASACQAGGLLLSKQGMGHGWLPVEQHISPQTGTYIRMFFAGLGMIPVFILHRRWELKRRARGLEPARTGSVKVGLIFVACGTIVGPYLGVWMSLVATDRASVAVAQTLCSLSPVFILPFAVWVEKERIGFRAILGATVAVCGSAILFWYP